MADFVLPSESILPTEHSYIRPPRVPKIPGYDPLNSDMTKTLEERSHPQHSLAHRKGISYLINSIIIVLMSAFLFITLFTWAEVLKSLLDTIIITKDYLKSFYSKLIFAIIITVISIIMIIIFYKLYEYEQKRYLK